MAFSVNSDECAAPLPPPNQSTFTIGVLANRDVETTYREYTKTFREYLTLVAGARFDPPLTFEIVPVPFGQPDPLDVFVSRTVDFTFTNPALLSCIESETGISSILSQITRRNVGQTYDLTAFGGVIFTLAENDEVREIKDIKGKRIGLVSMSSLGGYVSITDVFADSTLLETPNTWALIAEGKCSFGNLFEPVYIICKIRDSSYSWPHLTE